MSQSDEHVDTSAENFIADFEAMDLRPLYNLQFLVGVNKEDLNNVKLLASTIRGPYNFEEMVEEVGNMWRKHMHHAKVLVLVKDRKAKMPHLDGGTINFIESRFEDIITNYILNQELFGEDEITCVAGIKESGYAEEDGKVKKELEETEAKDATGNN